VPIWVWVAVGGMLGAVARLGVDVVFAFAPWATLIVNVLGCFAIGWVMAMMTHGSPRHWVHPFLVVGVLGGFTTFSAFAADVVLILMDESPLGALGYIAATLIFGILAVPLGERVREVIAS
jgi:fluoride exporter